MNAASAGPAVLEVQNLAVDFGGRDRPVRAVKEASFSIAAGECLGFVGESGSGKTQLFMAAMGLLPAGTKVSGSVRFQGEELLGLGDALNRVRGAHMAMVFQDPMTALTPHLTIGEQLMEVLVTHRNLGGTEAFDESVRMLERVRMAQAARCMHQHPHELSGGMRQRVMIAMACLCRPELLIADEPTTALDTTVQAQILEVLQSMRRELHTAVALVTHDFALLAGIADRVVVMYAGRIVEAAAAQELFDHPLHPYTVGLLDCVPRWSGPRVQRLPSIEGQPPDPAEDPPGCAFAPRCPRATQRCVQERPLLQSPLGGRQLACHHPHD